MENPRFSNSSERLLELRHGVGGIEVKDVKSMRGDETFILYVPARVGNALI